MTGGQRHESQSVEPLLNGIAIPQPLGPPRRRPHVLTADRAYSKAGMRTWLRGLGVRPVVPYRPNEWAYYDGRKRLDRATYRCRAVIEQCVGWLKECRRISTRFEKLAVNFHGMIQLAIIGRYFRLLCSDRA